MACHAIPSAVYTRPVASAARPRSVWELHSGSLVGVHGQVVMASLGPVCPRARVVSDGLVPTRSWGVVIGQPRSCREGGAAPSVPRALLTGVLRGGKCDVEYCFRIEGYFWVRFDVILIVVIALLAKFVAVHERCAASAAECVPLFTCCFLASVTYVAFVEEGLGGAGGACWAGNVR